MNLRDFKKKLLKNPKVVILNKDLAFNIGNMIIEARVSRGMTQKELAKKISTKQPSIARLERGESMPSLSLLDKVAKALKTNLSVYFTEKSYVRDFIETMENNEQPEFITSDIVVNVYPEAKESENIVISRI